MKKIIFFLAIVLSLAVTKTFAQNGERMQEMQENFKAYLTDSMHLSSVMIDSVMSIRNEFQPKAREIFMDQSLSPDDKRSKVQALRTEMDDRYKSAGLSSGQVDAILNYEGNMRRQMLKRRDDNGGGNR
ncbi:MAG: hypothetical protein JST21_10625 [Bacteroidetes bacterium]|nr:hypothetical protein [Bacteroidota bacterium]